MNDIAKLIDQIRDLEEKVEAELTARRASMNYELYKKKAIFEKEVRDYHRKLRTGVLRFLSTSPFLTLLTTPVIYAMIVPIALLDICVTIYQQICFSAWGIRRVKRANYVVIDRQYLAYLNIIEKFNCVYCGYGNGVFAYAHEVSSRTEQYWCPIKHARRAKGQHGNTRDFLEYGDGEAWQERLEELRRKLK